MHLKLAVNSQPFIALRSSSSFSSSSWELEEMYSSFHAIGSVEEMEKVWNWREFHGVNW